MPAEPQILVVRGVDPEGRLRGAACPGIAALTIFRDGERVARLRLSRTGGFALALSRISGGLASFGLTFRHGGDTQDIAAGRIDRHPDGGYVWSQIFDGGHRYDARVDRIAGDTVVGTVIDTLGASRDCVVDILVDGRHHRSVRTDRDGAFAVSLDLGVGMHQVSARLATEDRPFFVRKVAFDPREETNRRADSYAEWSRAYGLSRPAARIRTRLAAAGRSSGAAIVVFGPRDSDRSAWDRTLAAIAAQHLPPLMVLLVQPPPGLGNTDQVVGDRWDEVMAAAEGADALLAVAAGDVLEPAALLALRAALDDAADAPFVYGDEDRPFASDDPRRVPVFKTAWDADLAQVQDTYVYPALVRRTALASPPDGMFDAANWHAALMATGLEHRPHHLPLVLLHRDVPHDALDTPPPLPAEAASPDEWPLVSVIVPTRDMLHLLAPCVEGLLFETDYPALEVIVMDNESADPETLAFLAGMSRDPRFRVIRHTGPFDYSAINNRGVAESSGDIVALLNNDIAVRHSDWLKLMVREALRPGVGAVGARLLYGNGRLQHGGIALGIGGIASHLGKRMHGSRTDPNGRLAHVHQVSAVTAACLVVKRRAWDEVGGLSPDFPIAFNDVDFCLRLRQLGYRNLVQPAACLFHHESASRGRNDDAARQAQFVEDTQRMRDRWDSALADDPFVSPNWSFDQVRASPAFPPRYRAFFDQEDAISRQ